MEAKATYTLRDLLNYFLKLGTIGFGGPVALVGYMHRDLVEGRKWISEEDYKEGMALSQLAPGPLAAQLSIYIGYVHYGVRGATLAGLAFVLPSFLMVLGISVAYVAYGGLPWMQGMFYGVGAAVIGIIAIGAWKLSKKTLGDDVFKWGIFLTLAFTTWYTGQEIVWLMLLLAVGFMFLKAPPKRIAAGAIAPLPLLLASGVTTGSQLGGLAWFFTKAGAFVFGSGLAIVPFLYGGVVKEHGWLTEQQFLDAVAVAMITPGPVVITVAFIGFLVAGFWGACVAAVATFLPCWVFTVLPAPYFKKYGKQPSIKAFVDGITAAACGAIAGAVVVLGSRSLVDLPTWGIAIATVAVLLYVKKVKEPLVILVAALSGMALRGF